MNLWHDIPAGEKDTLNVIIEIPKFSKNKYEIDKATGLIALDRVMHSAQDYPFDYGFVPQTYWHDDDALDVILLTTYPLSPGILVRARPVALLRMIDGGERDDKIIAVPSADPRWDTVKDKADINPHTLREIEHFFSTYKQVQHKEVSVSGVDGRAEAEAAFAESRALYADKFPVKNAVYNLGETPMHSPERASRARGWYTMCAHTLLVPVCAYPLVINLICCIPLRETGPSRSLSAVCSSPACSASQRRRPLKPSPRGARPNKQTPCGGRMSP